MNDPVLSVKRIDTLIQMAAITPGFVLGKELFLKNNTIGLKAPAWKMIIRFFTGTLLGGL